MSTKRNPGPYACYDKLDPDEPFFVLRAKDPLAPAVVEAWATAAALTATSVDLRDKSREARAVAVRMRLWANAQLAEQNARERLTPDEEAVLAHAQAKGVGLTAQTLLAQRAAQADRRCA